VQLDDLQSLLNEIANDRANWTIDVLKLFGFTDSNLLRALVEYGKVIAA